MAEETAVHGANKWEMSSGTVRDGETLLITAIVDPTSSSPSVVSSLSFFSEGSAFSLLRNPLPHNLILSCFSTLTPRFFRCCGEDSSPGGSAVGVALELAVASVTGLL